MGGQVIDATAVLAPIPEQVTKLHALTNEHMASFERRSLNREGPECWRFR